MFHILYYRIGIALAHFVLARAPHTHLLYQGTATATTYIMIRYTFKPGDKVLVQDFHPTLTLKWQLLQNVAREQS